MIKNIVFDMGGVLIQWNPDDLLTRHHVNEQERKVLMENLFHNWKWSLLDAGYYNEQQLVDEVCPLIPEKLRPIVRDIVMDFGRDNVPVMPGMPQLVKRLKDNGYKIYLLSNAGPRHHEYWCKVEGHEYFDGVFVSALYKMIKPERIIYKTMLETFKIKAEESVFIDDMPINCTGAFLSGITPINFKGTDNLIAELTKIGVNCN